MTDRSNGKIYKITCESGKVYIGSTIMKLNKRFSVHKCKNSLNHCITKDFINPKIELIELFSCETKEELLWKEREWIEKTDCVNYVRPIITDDERKAKNKEYKQKQENKAKINEGQKKYRQKEENKTKINERQKKYRQEHKIEISKKAGVKFNCECGGKYQHSDKARHAKTKKHIAYFATK